MTYNVNNIIIFGSKIGPSYSFLVPIVLGLGLDLAHWIYAWSQTSIFHWILNPFIDLIDILWHGMFTWRPKEKCHRPWHDVPIHPFENLDLCCCLFGEDTLQWPKETSQDLVTKCIISSCGDFELPRVFYARKSYHLLKFYPAYNNNICGC